MHHKVTERARKLRAQYALQAQSLRTRIELRINRIPTAIRKSKMGDLWQEHQLAIANASHSNRAEPSSGRTGTVAANISTDYTAPKRKGVAPRVQSKTTIAREKGIKRTR